MKTAEVVQTLEAMAEDPARPYDSTRYRALTTAAIIIRSLPKPLLTSMDILLDLVDTRPKP
jgi:broad specificity phosphatase PhoE